MYYQRQKSTPTSYWNLRIPTHNRKVNIYSQIFAFDAGPNATTFFANSLASTTARTSRDQNASTETGASCLTETERDVQETGEENRLHKTEAAEASRREMKHRVEELFSDDLLQQLDRGKFSNYIASSHSPEQSISPTPLMIPSSTLLLLRVPGVAYGHTTAVPKRGRTKFFFFKKPSGQDDWYTLPTPDGWTSTITKLLLSLEVQKTIQQMVFPIRSLF